MVVSLRWSSVGSLLVLTLLFISVKASEEKDQLVHESRFVEAEKLQSSKNESMAARSEDAWINEHAVHHPEEVASMVDMSNFKEKPKQRPDDNHRRDPITDRLKPLYAPCKAVRAAAGHGRYNYQDLYMLVRKAPQPCTESTCKGKQDPQN